ncbi:hypothetical protein M3Y97_00444800 [Aphelenchoides bicaudatus]|nr:hypothetical protein M3Y97_00444800 [Aphelenchoides bicaudatus]
MFNSNGIPQWTINELARKCSQKLLEIQNQDQSLKSKARQFVDNVRKKTSLDVSDDFDWLLSTTTQAPTTSSTQSPTTTESSTTTSSTQSPTTTSSTQSPTTTESSTTTPKMHTTYKISSFMNDNITVSYKTLILICLAVLTIFSLTTLLIFRFANRQYLYRLEPENSYQMSTLVSNSRLSN